MLRGPGHKTPEDNPALGLRGLRALRASEDILREQLTALANADKATSADLWVMAPMVSTVEETEYFVALAKDYGIKTAGVMVEVPSAALMADRVLADPRVDGGVLRSGPEFRRNSCCLIYQLAGDREACCGDCVLTAPGSGRTPA